MCFLEREPESGQAHSTQHTQSQLKNLEAECPFNISIAAHNAHRTADTHTHKNAQASSYSVELYMLLVEKE